MDIINNKGIYRQSQPLYLKVYLTLRIFLEFVRPDDDRRAETCDTGRDVTIYIYIYIHIVL